MLDAFRSGKQSTRLRAIGWLVLVAGLIGAGATYGIGVHNADEALNDATALGYRRSLNHGVGVMMGSFGLKLSEWQEAWTSPLGMAVTVAVGAGLFAGYFFRVAWVLDDDEREAQRRSGQGGRVDRRE